MMRRAVLLVGLALCGAGWGGEMEWMRRGTIYLDVNAASELQVTYRDGAAAEGYLYVFGPDGNALAREPVPIGMTAATVALDAGPGTYRAVVTGGNPWRAEAPGARIVFEPEREWTSLHQADDVQRRYYFRVPEGTERFTLSATNQNGEVGTPGLVRLRDPRGEVAIALDLQRIDRSSFMQAIGATSRAEAEVKYRILTQTHTVERPAPGLWSVEAGCRGCADDVGFWLDGVPNLFAASPEDWFEPTFPPTAVSITVDATQVVGPTGKPAAIASFVKQPEQVLALLRELGMTAITDYCGQDYREPSNDDADPMHLNWPGFNFAPADGRMEYLRESGLTTLTHIYGRAPEWLGAVGSDQWMANLDEVAEFTAAYIYHYVVDRGLDMEYFTFINEPNLAFSAHEDAKRRYIASCVAAGRRVKALQHPRLAGVKFGGPDIVIGETPSPCWAWVADLLDAADE